MSPCMKEHAFSQLPPDPVSSCSTGGELCDGTMYYSLALLPPPPPLDDNLANLLVHIDQRLWFFDAAAARRNEDHARWLEDQFKLLKQGRKSKQKKPNEVMVGKEGLDQNDDDPGNGEEAMHPLLVRDIEEDSFSENHLKTRMQPYQSFLGFVQSDEFDMVVGVFIFWGGILNGFAVDYRARYWPMELPLVYDIWHHVLCFVFLVEILSRAIAYGPTFSRYLARNWMDTAVLILMFVDEIVMLIKLCCGVSSYHRVCNGIGVLRVVRIFRVIRLVRRPTLVRILTDLRTVIVVISDSVAALLGCISIIIILTYVWGVSLVALMTTTQFHDLDQNDADVQRLLSYFGSVDRAVLTLFQIALEGLPFSEVMDVLRRICPWWFTLLFFLYAIMCKVALLNIVTSLFVTKATKYGTDDMKHVQMELFLADADTNGSGTLDFPEFEKQLQHPFLQELLGQEHITPETAAALFMRLDGDRSGEVSIEELVKGCVNIQQHFLTEQVRSLMESDGLLRQRK